MYARQSGNVMQLPASLVQMGKPTHALAGWQPCWSQGRVCLLVLGWSVGTSPAWPGGGSPKWYNWGCLFAWGRDGVCLPSSTCKVTLHQESGDLITSPSSSSPHCHFIEHLTCVNISTTSSSSSLPAAAARAWDGGRAPACPVAL
jgi:hypothetical protein